MSNEAKCSGDADSRSIMRECPHLLEEWDYARNADAGISINAITCGSNIEAWWLCKAYKHSYKMSVYKRTRTSKPLGCPYCSNRKVLKGFNDLQSNYPDLIASEWDWIKNNQRGLKPDAITCGSYKKAWWLCETCNGSYEMHAYNKTHGIGCPFCAGKKVLTGYNDILTLYPDLINSEWDYDNNDANNVHPDELSKGPHVISSWLCGEYKHSYEASIYMRTINKQGCPYCAGKRVLKGFNDLQSCYPELIDSEWNYEKNTLHPDDIIKYSNRKAWWRCSECSYEWNAKISNRTLLKQGCPVCAKHRNHHISNQENEVAEYIKKHLCNHYAKMNHTMFRSITFNEIYKKLNIDCNNVIDCLQYDMKYLLKELDIYIPELGLAVEYDGDYWHDDANTIRNYNMTNDELHSIKHELCLHAGIKLLFISENRWLHYNDDVKSELDCVISERMRIMNHS